MATVDPLSITYFRGDSYPINVTVKDNATGEPIDLAGATLRMTVDRRENPTDNTTKLFEISGVIKNPSINGRVLFTPTSEYVANIGNFFYDIQMVTGSHPNEVVRTIAKSKFNITQDITKT
jgi:hypothetical protein